MKENKWITMLVLSILLSCQETERNEKIDFESFDEAEKPMICVLDNDSVLDNYVVEFWFCPTVEIMLSKAQMYKREGSFFFSFTEPKTKEFCLFDFTKPPQKSYEVLIDFDDNQFGLERVRKRGVLENKSSYAGDSIFVFRIEESYCYEEEFLDVVYFVSRKRGVLGSYISRNYNGAEYYTWPRGKVLDSLMDFSGMKEMSLQ